MQLKQRSLRARCGFTLAELLIAIGILGALATIVIIALNPTQQLEASQDAGRRVTAREIKNGVLQYIVENGTLPPDLVGVTTPTPICAPGRPMEDSCVGLDILVESEGAYLSVLQTDPAESDPELLRYEIHLEDEQVVVASTYLDEATEVAWIIEQVSDIRSGDSDSPIYLTVMDDDLFFVAFNANGYHKLFKTNGASVTQVSDTRPGNSDGPSSLTVMDGELYFVSINANGYVKLFKTDGTTVTQMSDTRPGNSDAPAYLTAVGDELYFVANNADGYVKLFKTNGTTVTQVSDIRSGNSDIAYSWMNPFKPVVFGSEFYFVALNTSGYAKLYKTDGTAVTQMSDIRSGNSDFPSFTVYLTVFGDELYFAANNAAGQNKLFRLRAQ